MAEKDLATIVSEEKLTSEIKSLKTSRKYKCKYCQKWDNPFWKCPKKYSNPQDSSDNPQTQSSNNVNANSELGFEADNSALLTGRDMTFTDRQFITLKTIKSSCLFVEAKMVSVLMSFLVDISSAVTTLADDIFDMLSGIIKPKQH